MAKNFSDTYLKNLKPQDKIYQVREATGFALRVMPTGTKTFLYIYEVAGKRKQVRLGNYPLTSLADAQKKYNELLEAQYNGEPVIIEKPKAAPDALTIKDVIDRYLVNCKKSDCATWLTKKTSILNNKLEPWHQRPIESITKDEAIKRIDDEYSNGSGAARNVYRITRALFEFALAREYINSSPFDRMKKIIVSLKNPERTRFLTEKEIQVVWKGIDDSKTSDGIKRILKTILVTAQRPGEVAGMHSREIFGDWWTIPAERAEKRKVNHRVFLTDTAKALIGDTEGFIFPSRMSDSSTGYIYNTTVSQRVAYSDYFGTQKWTPHDLRRSAHTHMSRLRIPREHSEAVLNHARQGMVNDYDQYEFDVEKKEALQAWERELLRLVIYSSTS